MIDHLIITERKYYSFKNSGLLDEIAKSQKYVVKYKQEEERLKNIGRKEGFEEGEKVGIEKGVKKGRKEGEKIGIEKGIEVGRKEGLKEGELKKAVELAKGMKQAGIDIKIIAKLSHLTEEQIEKL